MNAILARAVIISGDRLLVAQAKDSSHVFLPGGHRESGEHLRDCLRREIREELGIDSFVGRYLGLIEHTWLDRETLILEINHCFLVSIADSPVRSLEENIDFHWKPLLKLASLDLRPPALLSLIPRLVRGDQSIWDASISEANQAPEPMPHSAHPEGS